MATSKRFLCFGVSACSFLLPSYSRHAPVKSGAQYVDEFCVRPPVGRRTTTVRRCGVPHWMRDTALSPILLPDPTLVKYGYPQSSRVPAWAITSLSNLCFGLYDSFG